MINPFKKRKIEVKEVVKEVVADTKEVSFETLNSHMYYLDQPLMSNRQNSKDNVYPNKNSQVNQLIKAFKGEAQWGCEMIKRLINLAICLKAPNGIELTEVDAQDSPELAYIEGFMDVNQTNEGLNQMLLKAIEFTGECLIILKWDETDNYPRINLLPWNQYHYKVYPIGKSNLSAPYKVEYDDKDGNKVVIQGDDIAYVSFNTVLEDDGSISGYPTLGGVIARIEAISKDLSDWRIINSLFSSPTPFFKVTAEGEANKIYNDIVTNGWKAGKTIAAMADFSMVAPNVDVTTISESILMNMKILSGATGISMMFLGFGEVQNRSSAETQGQGFELASHGDISLLISFWEQILDRVILMRNRMLNSPQKLKLGIVKPKIVGATDRQIEQLVSIFMPSAEKGLLSKELFVEQASALLKFDKDEEIKNLEEEQTVKDDKLAEQKKELMDNQVITTEDKNVKE